MGAAAAKDQTSASPQQRFRAKENETGRRSGKSKASASTQAKKVAGGSSPITTQFSQEFPGASSARGPVQPQKGSPCQLLSWQPVWGTLQGKFRNEIVCSVPSQ